MSERERERAHSQLVPSCAAIYTTAATLQWDTFSFPFFFSIFLVLSRCTISVLSSRCVCSHLTSSFYSFFGTHHGLGNLLSFFPFFPHRICYHHHHRNVPLSLLFSYFLLLLLLWSIVRHILFAAVDALTALSFFFSASFSLVLYGCC